MTVSKNKKGVVKERARFFCEYCKSFEGLSPDTFSIDHIIPLALGGSDDINNLALACQGCNGRKLKSVDGIDPVTGLKVKLFNPRADEWRRHFAWDSTCTQIIPLSAIGRVTIEKLKMNRSSLVRIRKMMYFYGFRDHLL